MKSISPGTVTIGVLAIVFGLVGVYVARRAMEPAPVVEKREGPKPRAQPGPSVVFAKSNLPARTRVTDRDLTIRRLKTNEQPPAGSVASEEELIGRITKVAIRAGSVMQDNDLFDIGEGPNPADMIPADHVAVSILATGNRINHDLVRMGSRVNVAWTVEDKDDPEIGKVLTTTILENALVVSTGRDDFEKPSPSTPTRTLNRLNQERADQKEITLAVPLADANKLIAAQKVGELSVTLSSFEGVADAGSSAIDFDTLAGIVRPVPTVPVSIEPPPAPQPPQTFTVERWVGGEMKTIEFPASRIREAHEATVRDRLRSGGTVPVNIDSGN